jgi:prolyl-tRNA editing enzyme YbaK/EbsC (Cys-tRNA(Pro) deacylase)
MNHELSPSAQKIQDTINDFGYDYKVVEFQETTRTSADAAERVGCKVGQIVKSLVFRGHDSGKAVLILTSGANRVDVIKLARLMGESIDRADPEFVRTVTGFAIGGIPPIGHATRIESYIDGDLQNYDTLWAAAGTPNAVFELTYQDLLKMTSATVVYIKEI